MRVAITGANGYIGSALTAECLARGFEVVTWSRTPPPSPPVAAAGQMTTHCSVDGLADASTLAGCDTLVHLAGRAHNFNAPDADEALFEWSNHQLAIAVAERARDAGIRRFIQVSTVSVHGNWSDGPVNEESPLRATTAYARSKSAAEESLSRFCSNAGMGLCIVRPPLVYGPRCPGNFSRLVRLVASGMPLPLCSIQARRSFIHLDNLIDFLCHCMASSEDAAQNKFVIGDGSDWLMPDLVRAIALQLRMRPRLVPCPVSLLRAGALMLGRRREIDSITRSLLVDWSRARDEGHWRPAVEPAEAFARTMSAYRE